MRPGDPNAWELTAPEEERARPSGFVPGMRYGTGGNVLTAPEEEPRIGWPLRIRAWKRLHHAVNRLAHKYAPGYQSNIDRRHPLWRLNDRAAGHWVDWWIANHRRLR